MPYMTDDGKIRRKEDGLGKRMNMEKIWLPIKEGEEP